MYKWIIVWKGVYKSRLTLYKPSRIWMMSSEPMGRVGKY